MSKPTYMQSLLAGKSPKFVSGFKLGLTAFAWWKDGVQHVGTCGTKLKDVLKEIQDVQVASDARSHNRG